MPCQIKIITVTRQALRRVILPLLLCTSAESYAVVASVFAEAKDGAVFFISAAVIVHIYMQQ
jgi:hypothetical protein